jgi:predicted GIY-YIG superfamily endonuclease
MPCTICKGTLPPLGHTAPKCPQNPKNQAAASAAAAAAPAMAMDPAPTPYAPKFPLLEVPLKFQADYKETMYNVCKRDTEGKSWVYVLGLNSNPGNEVKVLGEMLGYQARFYIGKSADLPKRMKQHRTGKGGETGEDKCPTRFQTPLCVIGAVRLPDMCAAAAYEASLFKVHKEEQGDKKVLEMIKKWPCSMLQVDNDIVKFELLKDAVGVPGLAAKMIARFFRNTPSVISFSIRPASVTKEKVQFYKDLAIARLTHSGYLVMLGASAKKHLGKPIPNFKIFGPIIFKAWLDVVASRAWVRNWEGLVRRSLVHHALSVRYNMIVPRAIKHFGFEVLDDSRFKIGMNIFTVAPSRRMTVKAWARFVIKAPLLEHA